MEMTAFAGRPMSDHRDVDAAARRGQRSPVELFSALAREVGSAPAFDAAVGAALRTLCAATGWSYGEAWVPDGQGHLTLLVSTELEGGEAADFVVATRALRPTPGTGLVGRCWSERTAQRWRADGGEIRLSRSAAAARAGLRVAVAAPALHGRNPLAVLAFFGPRLDLDVDGFAHLVVALASQISAVLARKKAEDAHRELSVFLAELVASAPMAIIALDAAGRVSEWNQAASEIFGWPREEAFGRALLEDLGSARRLGLSALGRALAGERVRAANQRVIRPDGTERWVDVALAPLAHPGGGVHGVVILATDVTERHEMEERVVEAQIQERRKLGEDLHDDVGQRLSGLVLMAGALASALCKDPTGARGLAARIRSVAEETSLLVRRLARGVYPFRDETGGLDAALAGLGRWVEGALGVRYDLAAREHVTLGRVGDTELVRVAKEAVTNAVTHGGASRVHVHVREGRDSVTMVVRNDGVSIAPEDDDGGGMGLRNMRHRVERLGGLMRVRPIAGGGTSVACLVPRALRAAEAGDLPA